MKRIRWAVLGLFALMLAACGPAVVVENNTRFPVRVVVTSGGHSDVVSPSPGESSAVDASIGSFSASAVPDAEWIDYAKTTRSYLNEQLANAANLTGPQLLDVIQRLKDIAGKIQSFESAASSAAHCDGSISESGDGAAGQIVVSTGADGKLALTCK